MQIIDAGYEISPFLRVTVTPPTEGTCPVCAAKHPPHHPHDWHSIYYQMRYRQENGRLPTMEDAMAHCSDDAKCLVRHALSKKAERG